MKELIFVVDEAPEGGFRAQALGECIFAEADDIRTLHENVRDAVTCHIEGGQTPAVVRLQFVRGDTIVI